jgi:hypothetical protein
MTSVLNRLHEILSTFQSQFGSIDHIPFDVLKSTAQSKVKDAEFQLPVFRETKNGVVGSLKTKRGSFIVSITKPEEMPWSLWRGILSPRFAELAETLGDDDDDTRTACAGADYSGLFRIAIDGDTDKKELCARGKMDEMFEFICRRVIRQHIGSMLWWLSAAQMWMDEMENAPDDGMRVLFAKRAQIAHGHAESAQLIIEHEMRVTVKTMEVPA